MQITLQQMGALRECAYAKFDRAMCDHLAAFNPPLAKVAGQARLKLAVQAGRRRAVGHGFTQVNTIQLYLELGVLLGHRFDADPQLPWAGHLLRDNLQSGESARAQRLFEYAMRYFEMTDGARQAQLKESLRTTLAWTPSGAPPDLGELQRLHPAKARMAGPEALTGVLAAATARVQHAGMAAWAALPLAAMMLFCGSAVADDPFYPWLADSLRLDERPDAEVSAQRLLARVRLYGRHALAHLEQD